MTWLELDFFSLFLFASFTPVSPPHSASLYSLTVLPGGTQVTYVPSNKMSALLLSDVVRLQMVVLFAHRASVFTDSSLVYVGCNVNTTTQLYYKQADEPSLVCELTQTHTAAHQPAVHAHICTKTH